MALQGCLLASLTSGVIGSFVVIKRISFIAGSIAHSVLAGMSFFLWLNRSFHLPWLNPIWGAFLTAIGSAFLLGWMQNYKQREDSVIAALWSTGMAIGMIFLSLTPGTNVELFSYLFGNILWIQSQDLFYLTLLTLFVFAIVALFYHQFLTICLDEEQAHLQKISVRKMNTLLLCLLATSIVFLMQIMGSLLVIAMLTVPATLANLFTHRLWIMMGLSIVFCSLFSLFGLYMASSFNWPPAATIALLSTLSYLLLLPIKKKKFYFKKNRSLFHLTKPLPSSKIPGN